MKRLTCIILSLLIIITVAFSGCSQDNNSETKRDLIISDEVQEIAQENIEDVENGKNIETKEVIDEGIAEEDNLEIDGIVDQENIAYNGTITGKGLNLLGKCNGDLVYFSQADSRWANVMYSVKNDKTQTIKSSGCGCACSAMVISSSKGSGMTPLTMAKLFMDNGYRTRDNGTAWSAYSFVADYFGFKEYYETSSLDKVKKYVSQDKNKDGRADYFVIMSCGYGLFTTGGHYICIMGYNEKTDEFLVFDPYLYNGKFDTASRKNAKVRVDGTNVWVKFDKFKQYANMKNAWVFSNDYVKPQNPTTTKKPTTTEITKTKEIKYVNCDVLLVRKSASTNSDIVDRLKLNTKVTYNITKNGFAKIGKDRWVSIKYLSANKTKVNVTYKTTVGKKYKLKNNSVLYSKSNLTGTKYNYYANTTVKVLKHISSNVDYVLVVSTGRKAYINVKNI